ncbi:hypothetical protein EV426DRAFT_539816, partial [Tirmania nivea]
MPNQPLHGPALPLPGPFSHHHHHQLQQHQHQPVYPPHEIHSPHVYPAQAYAHDHPTPPLLNTPASRGPMTPHFKRSYQACMPCRSRKVKCDLGNPDAPNAPPCARCRREGKECVFSGPRASTKRRQDVGEDGARGSEGNSIGRSRSSSEGADGGLNDGSGSGGGSAATPGAGTRATKRKKGNNSYPLRRWDEQTATYRRVDLVGTCVSSESSSLDDEYDHARDEPEEEEGEEDILVTTKIHSTNDAMNLLFQAAERASRLSPVLDNPSEDDGGGNGSSGSGSESGGADQEGTTKGMKQAEQPALKVWQTFKFCQLKWVTPFEAFTYVNYFHTHLLPLSPILSSHFALPSAQHDLLTNEPLLAVTILTIAARYCPLGAASRGVYLHGKLWQFTQGLVGRVIWGQDRGTGKRRGKETKGLRGLGTVEALVLWTEWHPREIHFPPVDVGGEEELIGGMGMGVGLTESDRWLEEVVEPTRRSDRLSWMLLGTALNLAHELGIFDTSSADDVTPAPTDLPVDTETPRRIFRLRKLCYIYLHSLSTRLNWSSPLDNNRKLLTIITNHTETAYIPGQVVLTKYEQKWHKVMALYLDLTVLVRNATEMLFPSKRFTKDIVRTGKYVGLVEHFGQVLSAWERGSEELNKHKGPFWKVLRIEYCYARIFVYCISLEAVGERRKEQQIQEREKGKEKGKEKEDVDWDFIQMAFSSGLEILSIVTTNGEVATGGAEQINPIAPSNIPWLRFAPVRVYVRIIFAAIFLLKATALLLSLGPGAAPQTTRMAILAQSKKCLHLLSRTIEVLRRCAVDDVHLANTFAELL